METKVFMEMTPDCWKHLQLSTSAVTVFGYKGPALSDMSV